MRGGQLLYPANDRIGWNAALHPGHRTWIEVSFSGALLAKYDLKTSDGTALWAVAMTASGNVYARIVSKNPNLRGLVTLDRSQGVWRRVTGYPSGALIGSDGDNLVFSNWDENSTTLQFVPSGAIAATTRAAAPRAARNRFIVQLQVDVITRLDS